MGKANIRALHHGREVWKHLEGVMVSHTWGRVFEDWLDLMLMANLSLTDNMNRPNFKEKFTANKLDGIYEDRYMAIVERYADGKEHGQRAIDHFANAHATLILATKNDQADVLGEIYMAMITFGEHGQFFTPQTLSSAIAETMELEDGAKVLDPACGSGTMLIEAGKRNAHLELHGYDLDPRCAKMATLNMLLFGFNAVIRCGDSLSMQFTTEWRISKGGFIWEHDISQKKAALQPLQQGQQELFAA